MLERPRTAEELLLGIRQVNPGGHLLIDETDGANEIRNLAELVLGGLDRLRKLDIKMRTGTEEPVEKVRDRLLPTVVVDLDPLVLGEIEPVPVDQIGKLSLQALHNRNRSIEELLVRRQADILERDLVGEGQHPVEYLAPQIPVHEDELVVRMDDRPGMEIEVCNPDVGELRVETIGQFADGEGLVMRHKRKDVESGGPVIPAKNPRFVHKYTQHRVSHSSE